MLVCLRHSLKTAVQEGCRESVFASRVSGGLWNRALLGASVVQYAILVPIWCGRWSASAVASERMSFRWPHAERKFSRLPTANLVIYSWLHILEIDSLVASSSFTILYYVYSDCCCLLSHIHHHDVVREPGGSLISFQIHPYFFHTKIPQDRDDATRCVEVWCSKSRFVFCAIVIPFPFWGTAMRFMVEWSRLLREWRDKTVVWFFTVIFAMFLPEILWPAAGCFCLVYFKRPHCLKGHQGHSLTRSIGCHVTPCPCMCLDASCEAHKRMPIRLTHELAKDHQKPVLKRVQTSS